MRSGSDQAPIAGGSHNFGSKDTPLSSMPLKTFDNIPKKILPPPTPIGSASSSQNQTWPEFDHNPRDVLRGTTLTGMDNVKDIAVPVADVGGTAQSLEHSQTVEVNVQSVGIKKPGRVRKYKLPNAIEYISKIKCLNPKTYKRNKKQI